jgi:hypothetical protein
VAVFTETIKLEDAVTQTAIRAKSSLENLTTSLLKQQKAEGTGKADAGALAQAAKAKSAATQTMIADQSKLTNTMATVRDAVGSSVAGMKAAFTSLASGDVKGALAGVTDSIAGMAKLLDLVVPGLGQAAAVVIQIAGGLVGITAGLIKSGVEFAISSSEAKQAMLSLFDAMGGGVTTGLQVEEMIDGVKAKFGIAKDSLIGYTNELHKLGVTDLGQLESGILALASASALVNGGDQALLSFRKKIDLAVESGGKLKIATKQLASLGETGANVGDVAKVMGISVETLTKNLADGSVDAKKFGDALQTAIITKGKGPLERMAASSANLKKLLSEAWGDLFEDIDVGPFMAEVKKLFDIFGQGTESGHALKAGIGGFFKEVFAVLTKVVPLAKHFLLDLVIYGLKAYIAVKPIATAIKEFANSARGAAIISTVLSGLWEVLKVVGIAIGVVVVVALALWGAMIAVSVAVWTAVGSFLGFVAEAGGALTGWIASAATAAYDFVAGLVAGIANGGSMVKNAVSNLADGATGAFKGALGISSPSKVMMQMGGHMTEGLTDGLDAGAADVHGASSGMANAAIKGAGSPAASASGGGKGGGASIVVNVQIDGAGKSAAEITEELVASVFERAALGMGL